MRWKRVSLALLVVMLSAILGATVLREPIASAASPFTNVIVGNTAVNPVPVVEQKPTADDPGRSAFGYFEGVDFGTEPSPHAEFTVPAGKRLVIESVSVAASLPTGQNMLSAGVQAQVNGKLQDYFIAPTFTGLERLNLNRNYVASQQTTVYADAGTTVSVFAIRDSISIGGHFIVSVQGHLIDCTGGPCS